LPFSDAQVCTGVTEVQAATRRIIRDGYDFIKICTTGDLQDPPEHSQWTLEELNAIVYEASARGKAVMAHAQGAQGIKNAIRAGVWSVEHGGRMDDEALQMFLDTGTFLVPTLFIVEDIQVRGNEIGLPMTQKKYQEFGYLHTESFRRAAAAGVRIAVGTDALDENAHGRNAHELELMVRYGMTPMQAIVAATKTSSEVCRVNDKVGTLESGKLADLVVVNGDPLEDIAILQDQERLLVVMKEGKKCVNRL
jgi:imidazolonepropionase-like amidohydrolase